MTSVPDELRGRVAGVAGTGLNIVQLGAIIAAGAAAEVLPATGVVALAGVATLLALTAVWRKLSPHLGEGGSAEASTIRQGVHSPDSLGALQGA